MTDRKLHSKLAEVMAAVGYIPKNGYNDKQGYKFVAATDVADKVREELAKRKVIFIPTCVEMLDIRLTPTEKQQTLTLRATWEFIDSETGEREVVQTLASGSDSGDKAPYKAMTGSLKYALLMAFLIPTGDDPEADTKTDETEDEKTDELATEPMRRKVFAKAAAKGLSKELQQQFSEIVVQKVSSRQWTAHDVTVLLDKLDEPGLVAAIQDVKAAE